MNRKQTGRQTNKQTKNEIMIILMMMMIIIIIIIIITLYKVCLLSNAGTRGLYLGHERVSVVCCPLYICKGLVIC
jgi:heme/copper-type cytochrome/quinol oxidase subunit 2